MMRFDGLGRPFDRFLGSELVVGDGDDIKNRLTIDRRNLMTIYLLVDG